jgi:hypothetical protein
LTTAYLFNGAVEIALYFKTVRNRDWDVCIKREATYRSFISKKNICRDAIENNFVLILLPS